MKRLLRAEAVVCCACVLALASACKKHPDRSPGSGPAVPADGPAILATIPDDGGGAPSPTRAPAPGVHAAAPADREFTFGERGGGVAYVEQKGETSRVIHNGAPGPWYAAIGAVALGPDGRRIAYPALADGKWRIVVDGKEGPRFDAIEMPRFSPDGAHVAYQAMAGERWYLVVDSTVSGGTATRYASHAFVTGSKIVFIDDVDDGFRGRLVISDLALQKQVVIESHASNLVLDAARTRVAVVVTSGKEQRVASVAVDRPEDVRRGRAFDAIAEVAFGPGGASLAYVAERGGMPFMVLDDREEALPRGAVVIGTPGIRPDGKGLGVLVAVDGSVRFQEVFAPGARAERAYDEAEGLAYSPDGRSHAYSATSAGRQRLVVDGNEGPPFDRVVSPSFSPDGKLVVYRARQDGKRFVVVADLNGRTIRQHPAYEQVFPVLFTADGKATAYGVKDGPRLAWKVEAL